MEIKTFDKRLKLDNGDYDRLVHARKPKGIEDKRAYIIGSGLAGLSAAGFLIKDAQMDGKNIHFLEQCELPGGALDGEFMSNIGYVARGGREMGHHFEVLWDLFSVIPSAEDPEMTILDNLYYTNLDDPNYSNCRITHKCGERWDNAKFNLGQDLVKEIVMFLSMPDEALQDLKIEDVLSPELLKTDFWTFWRSMFAFENWHSALEMKLYMNRFIHHVEGLPNLSALQFTRHDQFISIVEPMIKWLKEKGVQFDYNTAVKNVEFEILTDKKVAKKIVAEDNKGNDKSIELTENDLVFITNGSIIESSGYGDDDTPAPFIREPGSSWELWNNIASQCEEFGNPEVFSTDFEKTNWESCTVTCHDRKIAPYIEKITKRSPYTGKTVTGGIVTARDSSWLMSWTINRQGQYPTQPKDDVVVWVYGLFTDKDGDYIKKKMRDCTGKEITKEWLYHIGVPIEKIDEIAQTCTAVPVMMPFITSHFMPRKFGDRPYVVLKDGVNFAFIGQFAETLDNPGRDTIFTTEYSGRTAMEAVYVLTGVEKAVPEVFASRYDIRYLLSGLVGLLDGEKPEIKLPWIVRHKVKAMLAGTEIEQILKEYNVIE